jgi:hypothetical protein
MNPSEKVISDFEKKASEFLEVLSSFSQEQFNEIPFEGSWTAGKVGRHIYKALFNLPKTLQGPVTKAERSPDELVEPINKIFMDYTIQLKSPDFIVPEDKEYDRQEMLAAYLVKIKETLDTARPLDLTATTGFQLPTIGHLTRMELIYFSSIHILRHTRQLKKIQGHFAITES